MQPTPLDEATHRPGDHRHWSESFYFNFFDASQRLGGATRIGFSPNRAHRDGFVILYLPGGETGFVRLHAPLDASRHGAAAQAIDAGALRFTCESPFARWRVHYEGALFTFTDGTVVADLMQLAGVDRPSRPLVLDLEFESLHPPYDFHASSTKRFVPFSRAARREGPWLLRAGLALEAMAALPAMTGASHYEQAVRVRGSVRVDGVSYSLEGLGQRDHSWGVRDMRVPRAWRWISAQFGEDFCFNATRVDVLGLEVSGGYTFERGKCAGLRGFQILPEPSVSGHFARELALRLVLADGRAVELAAEVLAELPVAVETDGRVTVVNEALARFTWNGRSTLGIVEAMTQRFP